MNLKKGNIVKYMKFYRGINWDGAKESKKIIQYIVD